MATREREKKQNREKTRDRRPMAEARYIRMPSDKVEIVLDLIRGKMYAEAAAVLGNTSKSACEPILKALNSAAANAENNHNIPKDSLYVAECFAGNGPTLKRMMPRARGRADKILKRTCHITIILDEKKEAPSMKKEVKKTPQKKETAKPVAQKNTTSAKPQPDIRAERPLTNEPNSKKPLGVKKAAATGGNKAGQAAKDAKTAAAKPAAGKETK